MQLQTILATLDLTDDTQREVCEVIRRFHVGRHPFLGRMIDVRNIGDQLIELAVWPSGGYAVVRWSLTEIALRWQLYADLYSAQAGFQVSVRP